MAFTLQQLGTGDRDYLAKLNTNFAALQSTISQLLALNQTVNTGGISYSQFLGGLFGTSALKIGSTSYGYSVDGARVSLTPGTAWKPTSHQVVASPLPHTLDFTPQPPGNYGIAVDSAGLPSIVSSASDLLYSVVWDGTTVTLTPVAGVYLSADEQAQFFQTLQDRLTKLESKLP